MADEIEIKGLRELRAAMLELPKKLDRRILTAALMSGAVLIRDEARIRAPILKDPDPRRRAGTVQKAIRAQSGRPNPGMTATVIVRVKPLTGKQIARFKTKQRKKGKRIAGSDNPNDPYYWRFLEFGTSKHPARAFLRPAFETKKEAAAQAIKPALAERIEVEAAKLNKGPK